MPFRRFAVYGLTIPMAAALAVRFGVEGAEEVLTWRLIAGLAVTFLGFYVLTVCSGMLAFANVTFGRKRVDILYGSDWALAVGQIAWLLGAYAVGQHWRKEKTSA